MALNPRISSSLWLSQLSSALHDASPTALADLFLPNGWLRDILVFTWDLRSLEGPEKIKAYLTDRLIDAQIAKIRLNETPDLAPRVYNAHLSEELGVEFAFTFECAHGHGRGYAHLAPDAKGVYRAFTLLTELSDLRGHEELSILPLRDELTAVPGADMQKEYADMVRATEANPYVIIGEFLPRLGAGKNGLQVATRFKQMNIPTVVIEREARVGDTWRKRYPSLTLHSTRKHHTWHAWPMTEEIYQQCYTNLIPQTGPNSRRATSLPIGWSTSIQDLIVWTSSELKPRPTYDAKDHRWDVTVIRDGVEVKLRPAHRVFATGTLGRPVIPDVPGMEAFQGRVVHSSRFPGGALYAGQHAVVVGAGNSSIDVCQDLALRAAASVTMVQRSTTCVMTREHVCAAIRAAFPDDVPLDVSDFRFLSMGIGQRRKMAIEDQEAAWGANRELHEKLCKGDVSFDLGPEGQGVYPLVYERFGEMDKGGADLIADGRIKVKSLVSLKHFTKNSLILSDGTELPADVVVFATGYTYIRETNAELLGEDVISQTEDVYGIDQEGELRGSYRPCGYPGLWFATGDFSNSRTLSKPLALQIKAIELGMMPNDGRREL